MNLDAMHKAAAAAHPERVAADGSIHWCEAARDLHNDVCAWHDACKPAADLPALEARRAAIAAQRPRG